jgi:cbb3-type cytochrome oxidase maturation protein
MDVIFGLIPGMILLGLVGVLIFFWAVRSGQYDDMDGAAHRIFDDDVQRKQDDSKQESVIKKEKQDSSSLSNLEES